MGTKKQILNTLSDNDSAVDNYCKGVKRVVEITTRSSDQALSAEIELIMKRKRSVILTIATRTGIKEVDTWTKFNRWMKEVSIYKKELYAYDYAELDELINQFRGIEKNFNQSAQKVGNKAWHHATGIPKPSTN